MKRRGIQTGYSWLGAAPRRTERRGPISAEENYLLEERFFRMEEMLRLLKGKVGKYHSLCHDYTQEAGSAHAPFILRQMDLLEEEISELAEDFSHNFESIVTLTHEEKKTA